MEDILSLKPASLPRPSFPSGWGEQASRCLVGLEDQAPDKEVAVEVGSSAS